MAALPMADLLTVTGTAPFLILAPHPDDESLGCGGLLALSAAAGLPAHVAVLTDGTKSHPNSVQYPAPRLRAVREAETAEAVAVLGLPPGRLAFLAYPDAAAPRSGRALREAGDRLAALVRARGAATVFASWRHDPHCDHLAAYRIAARACRLTGARHLSFPVWGWTLPAGAPLPPVRVRGWRLDVAAVLPAKRRAVACHRSQRGGLITDDPAGFVLPDRLLDPCERPFECFLRHGG